MKTIQLALRSLLHYKHYTIINILGLALSLTCVIIIFRYVYGEMMVDRFNKNLDRIFVTTFENEINPGRLTYMGHNNESFRNLISHPGIEKYSRVIPLFENQEVIVNNQQFGAKVLVADSNFFKILDFPIIVGVDRLSEPNSALITQEFAQRLFGNENPIGKTIQYFNQGELTITGIIKRTSTKSTLTFDVVLPIDFTQWANIPIVYALLHQNVDYRAINSQNSTAINNIRQQLFPLSDVYFHTDTIFTWEALNLGNYQNVFILMIVGLLILLVGVINYINIHTVITLRRGKELGVKKIFGASSSTVFTQMLIDNVLMISLALLLGLIFVKIVNPVVVNVLQLEQMPNIRFDVLLSVGILVVLSFITTLYPFFRYRYSTPVKSLRGFDKIRGGGLRRTFLTFQYIITIAMVIVSLFFVKQLNYMLNTDLGFRTENIIQVQLMRLGAERWIRSEVGLEEREAKQRISAEITHRMNASPLFTQWTANAYSPHRRVAGLGLPFSYLGGEFQTVNTMWTTANWFEVFDIQLVAGRLWNDELDERCRLIVTESALRFFGITDWQTAQLQPQRSTWSGQEGNPPGYIIGVVRDFTPSHLSQPSLPFIFTYLGDNVSDRNPLIASIVPGRTQDAIDFLRTLHEETVGGEFSYTFIEDEVRAMYEEDRKVATIYSFFTVIAIFISALGLFGMSFFDIQQRRKEIAIRKINGASVTDIINLLLKKYLISLGIAFVIAVPVAIYAINRYLEDFAHRASVSWWLFAVALLLTAGISLLTLIYQTYKAADQNPAEVVKSE